MSDSKREWTTIKWVTERMTQTVVTERKVGNIGKKVGDRDK